MKVVAMVALAIRMTSRHRVVDATNELTICVHTIQHIVRAMKQVGTRQKQTMDRQETNGNKKRGNCYVTSEALYHLLGGKAAGWKPMVMSVDGDTHWWLRHTSGLVLDATANQFARRPDYSNGRGTGFLTREPSKRAKKLMEEMVWQKVS